MHALPFPRPRPEGPRSATLAALLLASLACSHEVPAPTVTVHAAADLPKGVSLAADDLVADLAKAGAKIERVTSSVPPCTDGQVHVDVRGIDTTLGKQELAVDEAKCGDTGRTLVLRGGGLLAAQWAVYAVADAVGIRYLHPEQTLYPKTITWPVSLARREKPAFGARTLHAHRVHPIELSPPLDAKNLDMAGYQKRWIDWNVKLRQTSVDGWDDALVGTYAYDRGFPRTAGFALLQRQQGSHPIIDPDDPRPEAQQITEAIDERMKPVDGLPPVTSFEFQFNPSEFTEADDQVTVQRLELITNHITGKYPGAQVWTINHGTHGEPTSHYGVRFYDLPQFAPPALGASVHLLMFYGLDRAAPVYGNEDFSHQLAWIRQEAKKRRIEHYPESSWWLTFDLPVPLFLAPATLEARQKDLDLLGPDIVGDPDAPHGVVAHNIFSSGQEWTYWLIDYCVGRMTWDTNYTKDRCLADVFAPFEGHEQILNDWPVIEARQAKDLRDPELLKFLVGSDDATEAAFSAGIVFHPLPPAPKDVLAFDDAKVAALKEKSLVPLRAMAADYHAWASHVDALVAKNDAAKQPWIRELRDGLEIFALRAEHAAEVYETVLALRDALAKNDTAAVKTAYAGVERARALTEKARAVVKAREADYRYPAALTIDGDEAGTPGAIPNQTTYPYRYLSRTHRLFYWTRPDQQLAALFGEGLDLVRVPHRILVQGTPLDVKLLADGVQDLRVDWGDGTIVQLLEPHTYAKQGVFDWSLDARLATGAVHTDDRAAIVSKRYVFPKGSLQVQEPAGAALLNGLIPGFVLGLGEDDAPFLALGRLDQAGDVEAKGSLLERARSGSRSGPEDLSLDLQKVGSVVVHRAVLELKDGTGPNARELDIAGVMKTQEVIDLLVKTGGFAPDGARSITADILGTTPDELPEEIAFTITATGKDG